MNRESRLRLIQGTDTRVTARSVLIDASELLTDYLSRRLAEVPADDPDRRRLVVLVALGRRCRLFGLAPLGPE